MKRIGIIGPDTANCSEDVYHFGVSLGAALAAEDHFIICGGLGGFMEAVCRGAKGSAQTFVGQTVGILPGSRSEDANSFVDLVIPTGIGIGRNLVIVSSSDILIAAAGGAGTLAELAFAWQLGKQVLCATQFDGWAKELAGRRIDARKVEPFVAVTSVDDILLHLRTVVTVPTKAVQHQA